MNLTARFFFLICLFLFACGVNAKRVTDLYTADVAVSAETQQWQQQALLQVLIRISGQADIAGLNAVKQELKQASAYIKQFKSVRTDDEDRMQVVLDATKINQLLQQHQLPVWGELRPEILIWMVLQADGDRQFVTEQSANLNKELAKAFRRAGLPLLLPIYDFEDINSLSETDVWAGFWQQINRASTRYRPDATVAVAVESLVKDGQSLTRLTWQHAQDNRIVRDEVTAADDAELMQRFAQALAGQLAGKYATVLAAGAESQLLLNVTGIRDLADAVNVQRLLQQLIGVSVVTISHYDAGERQVSYKLQTNIPAEGLLDALKFETKLVRRDQVDLPQSIKEGAPVALASFRYIRQ